MSLDAQSNFSTQPEPSHDATRRHIRSSSLLLVGRLVAVGVNFISQVMIVRYLTQQDYGAWAYALTALALFENIVGMGLDRATTRFVPIYEEQGHYGRLYGTVLLVLAVVAAASVVVIAAFYLFPQHVIRLVNGEQRPLSALLILIFVLPVQAIDNLMVSLLAAFGNARAIFFRRHLLGPLLKLAVIIFLIVQQAGLVVLAYGYLLTDVIGLLLSSSLLVRRLRVRGLADKFRWSEVRIPAREIFGFTFPLLSSDLVPIFKQTLSVFLIGYLWGLSEVALFRVVLPAVTLNQLVLRTYSLLYTPTVARLYARQDFGGIREFYWRSAMWIAVLSFPLFAITFSFAQPLTRFLYGEQYASAGILMAVLALGYYFDVALGFNGLTLRVVGQVGYIVKMNFIVVAVSAALCVLLIPRFGALGAACAVSAATILQNVLKQAGLRLIPGMRIFEPQQLGFYGVISLMAAALFVVQFLIPANVFVTGTLVALASLVLLRVSGPQLRVAETFPELRRVPLMRVILREV